MHRRPRSVSHTILIILAIAVIALAAGAAGYELHHSAGPAPCYVMNGDAGPETGTAQQHNAIVPAGDAARFNDGVTRVCTDGTWVHVTGYGN